MYLGKVSAANQSKAMGLSAAIQGGVGAASMMKQANPNTTVPTQTDISKIPMFHKPAIQLPNLRQVPQVNTTLNLSSYGGVPSVSQPPNVQPSYNPFFGTAKFNPFFNSQTFNQ